jgi:hypothetical protein
MIARKKIPPGCLNVDPDEEPMVGNTDPLPTPELGS